MNIFDELESQVQSYARSFPCVFERAEGDFLYDETGKRYIDFLAGAGTLNYGHNNPILQKTLVDYIQSNGVTHSLDMHTSAKKKFLEVFRSHILQPRNLRYVLQFTGPTGANSVEAAMKLARLVTGRHNIIAFTNGFHGVTLGALSATGNVHHRNVAGVSMNGVSHLPYDGYMGDAIDTADYVQKVIADASSGVDLPAAIIVETVQGEGGINAASLLWLKKIEAICRQYDILLIIDDIQAGCGRTGTFFSFEPAGIVPDMVTLSKSISGYGVPFALLLIKPGLDKWKPGEHNGTFRGHNLAFVTATKAIEHYWSNTTFEQAVQKKAYYLHQRIDGLLTHFKVFGFKSKGRGMFRGIACNSSAFAADVVKQAFKHQLIIETSGANNEVVKFLCPLTIAQESLKQGLDIVEHCFYMVAKQHRLALDIPSMPHVSAVGEN